MDITIDLVGQIVKNPKKDLSRQNKYAEETNTVATKETLSRLNPRRMHMEQVATDYCMLQQKPVIELKLYRKNTFRSRQRMQSGLEF